MTPAPGNWGGTFDVQRTLITSAPGTWQPSSAIRASGLDAGTWTINVASAGATGSQNIGGQLLAFVNYKSGNGGNSQFVVDVGQRISVAVSAESIEVRLLYLTSVIFTPPRPIKVNVWIAPGDRASPQPLTFTNTRRVAIVNGANTSFPIPPLTGATKAQVLVYPPTSAYTIDFLAENTAILLYETTVASGALCPELTVPTDASGIKITNTGGADIDRLEVVWSVNP